MKKKLSFFLLGLVFAIFSFSTNALAIQNDTTYIDEQFISESDSLDEAYLTYTTEDDISYENGQIISESDSLDEAYLTYTTEDRISVLRDITDNSIEPLADELKKSKTITKFYTTFDQIPEYEHYREYSGGYWWGGYLFLTKTEKITGGWKATFSGYIYTLVE